MVSIMPLKLIQLLNMILVNTQFQFKTLLVNVLNQFKLRFQISQALLLISELKMSEKTNVNLNGKNQLQMVTQLSLIMLLKNVKLQDYHGFQSMVQLKINTLTSLNYSRVMNMSLELELKINLAQVKSLNLITSQLKTHGLFQLHQKMLKSELLLNSLSHYLGQDQNLMVATLSNLMSLKNDQSHQLNGTELTKNQSLILCLKLLH